MTSLPVSVSRLVQSCQSPAATSSIRTHFSHALFWLIHLFLCFALSHTVRLLFVYLMLVCT